MLSITSFTAVVEGISFTLSYYHLDSCSLIRTYAICSNLIGQFSSQYILLIMVIESHIIYIRSLRPYTERGACIRRHVTEVMEPIIMSEVLRLTHLSRAIYRLVPGISSVDCPMKRRIFADVSTHLIKC
jgi:hypothetical protein